MTSKLLILVVLLLVSAPIFAQSIHGESVQDESVDTAWVRRYNGPGNGADWAFAMTMDSSGNVYVTGVSYGTWTDADYATVKYYPNGDTAWARRYNGPDSLDDNDPTIAVDMSGNVYVTGLSHRSETNFDYVTIKYHSNGDIDWLIRYNGPVDGGDVPYGIAVDSDSNVYVTGGSNGGGTGYDYTTIKYVQFLCGDVNKDGVVNSADIIYLINYLFIGGPSPIPILHVGDVNVDEAVNSADVSYLINYLFIGGPAPCQ